MMEKRPSWWAVTCLVLLAVLITFMSTFLVVSDQYRNKYFSLLDRNDHLLNARLEELDNAFRSMYIGEIDDELLATVILKAYVYGTGDPYGEYLTAEEYAAFSQSMQGELYGIGVTVDMTDPAAYEIVLVLPDSPAERAGLKAGDFLIAADGTPFAEHTGEEVTEMIGGQLGTYVTLTVVRDGETFDMQVIREKVTTLSVLSHLNSDGETPIGVIRILTFDATTPEQCKTALNALSAEGVRHYVFDLRSNGGGSLDSVVATLDFLLPEGPIIHITDGEEEKEVISSDAACFEADGYVVLTDENTASAAELFSCALRDYGLAQLVGTKTYGKGCMQTYLPLNDGGCLRVTFRYYDPPYSENYDGVGLTPDLIVEPDETTLNTHPLKIADADDNQLMAAFALLTDAADAA